MSQFTAFVKITLYYLREEKENLSPAVAVTWEYLLLFTMKCGYDEKKKSCRYFKCSGMDKHIWKYIPRGEVSLGPRCFLKNKM